MPDSTRCCIAGNYRGIAHGLCQLAPRPPQREVLLGGLFSLTGNWSTLGQTGRAAMELAIEDVNRYLAGNAAGIHFAAAIEDTRLEPERALEKAPRGGDGHWKTAR